MSGWVYALKLQNWHPHEPKDTFFKTWPVCSNLLNDIWNIKYVLCLSKLWEAKVNRIDKLSNMLEVVSCGPGHRRDVQTFTQDNPGVLSSSIARECVACAGMSKAGWTNDRERCGGGGRYISDIHRTILVASSRCAVRLMSPELRSWVWDKSDGSIIQFHLPSLPIPIQHHTPRTVSLKISTLYIPIIPTLVKYNGLRIDTLQAGEVDPCISQWSTQNTNQIQSRWKAQPDPSSVSSTDTYIPRQDESHRQ